MITYTCSNLNCRNKVIAKKDLLIKCSCGNSMYTKHGIIDNGRRTPKTKRNKGFPYRKSSGKEKAKDNYIKDKKNDSDSVSDDFKHKGGKEWRLD